MISCPASARCLLVLLLIGGPAAPGSEIYRCTQDDGTVAFQETPCPDPAGEQDDGPDDANDAADGGESNNTGTAGEDDFVNPFDEPQDPAAAAAPELPEALSANRSVCEKSTRDAIDAIDLEMRSGYTEDEGQAYLAELLKLTKQLRACKAL